MPTHKSRSHPPAVESVRALLARWPSVAEFARDVGIKPSHAQTMKARGSIPIDHWPATIRAAKKRRIAGVSAEQLVKLHARVRPAQPDSEATAMVARVVKSGKRQSVQLPKQFHFRGHEVTISRRGQEVVLREQPRGMERAFEIIANLPIEDLADERDEPPQERKGL